MSVDGAESVSGFTEGSACAIMKAAGFSKVSYGAKDMAGVRSSKVVGSRPTRYL